MTMTTRANFSLGSAGLAEGTNANTFQIANIVHYNINGRSYRKAITDNLAFSAGTALATRQACVFWVLIDTAGTVTTSQSSIVSGSTAADYVQQAFEPPVVSDKAVIGAIVVETRNAATFTPGSTDLGASDVIDTFHNFGPVYGYPVIV